MKGAPRPALTVLVLMLVLLSNLLDRQVLAILSERIRLDLGLSDLQLGILNGLAFAALFGLATVLLGWLADRMDRISVLCIATLTWSVMCAACGIATNFPELCLARMGVAVGEAGAGPAAHAIISSLYPPERRGRAIAIFQLGSPLGILIAFAAGGPLAAHYGWRAAFLAAAVPGLLIAIFARLVLKDPYRARSRSLPLLPHSKHAGAGARAVANSVLTVLRSPESARLIIAGGFAGLAAFGEVVWLPVLFQRRFGWDVGTSGAVLGPMLGVLGLFGTFIGGWLGDKVQSHRADGYALVVSVAMLVSGVALAFGIFAPSAAAAIAIFTVPFVALPVFQGPLAAAVQNAAPPNEHALASSLYILSTNVLGLGLGPTLIGLLSDELSRAHIHRSLQFAILCTPAASIACGLILLIPSLPLRIVANRRSIPAAGDP